ncbi:histone acetyltransferase p300-like isoform X1 [Saccopteryx bilineata]|uniref:histone acetyltransferase p300-like isoform X1 n=1 Tax=Saccopteryx bilineata TaxID=59482 RepID=UPI00338D93E5
MENTGPSLDEAAATQSPADARHANFQRYIQALAHACQCRDASCSLARCRKMKRVVRHTRGCRLKTIRSCHVCKLLITLCCYHAKHCQENRCSVPFCQEIKEKLWRQQLHQQIQEAQMLCRRMANMLQAGVLRQRQGLPLPAPATPSILQTPQSAPPNSMPTQAEGPESQGKEPGQVTPLASPQAAQPPLPGPQAAAEEMEMHF